jgi:hypothetical protein
MNRDQSDGDVCGFIVNICPALTGEKIDAERR